jgi:Animal haem peroxidase
VMFTLFTLEHNTICDRLRAEYPSWSDDDIFEHARLINAALIAKIHTVEWTTAILGNPTLQIAMRANWWGLAMERVHDLIGRISPSELISGIPGSATDHYGVPYAMTEEFVAVYRMHPLIPDDFTFRSVHDGAFLAEHSLREIAGLHTAAVCEAIAMSDIIYSLGIANPGAVTLHNYPRSLQKFERPDGRVIDLASFDILRIRELGVPRYNRFRRLLHLRAPETFGELTDNPEWAEEIREVYNNDIESVDLMTGLYAEKPPPGFGFSDTAFRIFILMASRRLNSDRFFTVDFTPQVYTPVGMKWIDDNGFATILLRHYPELAPALRGVANPFAPWRRVVGPES